MNDLIGKRFIKENGEKFVVLSNECKIQIDGCGSSYLSWADLARNIKKGSIVEINSKL